jgi:CHASE2 domain-containing sensor protein
MPNDTIWTRVTHVAERAAGGLFRAALSDDSKLDTAESLCVYSDTVSAGQILNPQQQDEEVMRNLIKDRVILIGAGHSFTPDYHTIPHVGRVPGVFIHAMATDNLITDQDGYTRPPPSLIFDLDWADFIEILLTISVIVIMWQAQLFSRKHEDKGVRRRILLAGAGAGVLIIGVTLAVERMVLHWPPLNIFGVAVLAFSVVALLDDHSKDLAAPEKGG